MVEGGMACIKYILMIFNLVFVIFGILLVYFGFSVVKDAESFKELIDTPDTTAFVLVVIGFAIFVVAFLGCCGACKQSHCMLFTYGIILVIILVIELIAGGLAFAFKNDLRGMAETGINHSMSKYNWTNSDDPITRLIDDMQSNMKCCGSISADDWKKQSGRDDLPESCCTHGNTTVVTTVGATTCDKSKPTVHKKGCVAAFEEAMKNSVGPLGMIAIATALIQVLGIVFACCLGCHLRKHYEVV